MAIEEPDSKVDRRRGRQKPEDPAALDARIIAVSTELFIRNGYGATTTSAIAASARMSKSTLYSRFPSKEALFRAIIAAQIESWGSGANRIEIGPHETLEQVLNAYGNIALKAGMTPEYLELDRLVRSESGQFPELAEAVAARFELGVRYLADHIRAYAERDQFPCRNPEASARRFQMILNGWCSIVALRNREVSQSDQECWLRETVRHFIYGRAVW